MQIQPFSTRYVSLGLVFALRREFQLMFELVRLQVSLASTVLLTDGKATVYSSKRVLGANSCVAGLGGNGRGRGEEQPARESCQKEDGMWPTCESHNRSTALQTIHVPL